MTHRVVNDFVLYDILLQVDQREIFLQSAASNYSSFSSLFRFPSSGDYFKALWMSLLSNIGLSATMS